MADLTYLNEAAVLHNLRQRYYSKLIYVSAKAQWTNYCVRSFPFLLDSTWLFYAGYVDICSIKIVVLWSRQPKKTEHLNNPSPSASRLAGVHLSVLYAECSLWGLLMYTINVRPLREYRPRTSRRTWCPRSTHRNTRNARICPTWHILTMPLYSITWDRDTTLSLST